LATVVVTGGTGRLGRDWIVPELAEEHSVRVFGRSAPDGLQGDFVQGDITSLADVEAALEGADAAVHLAAVPMFSAGLEEEIWRTNCDGTFNVLEAARRQGVRDLVIASSVCAWGPIFWSTPQTPAYFPADEELPNRPDDMYGMSKLIGEVLAYGYSSRFGLRVASLRVASVGLLGDDAWVEAIRNVSNPDYTVVPRGNGEAPASGNGVIRLSDLVYQYVDPRDVAQAFRLALDAVRDGRIEAGGVPCDVFNIGAGDVFSTEESLELIRRYYPDAVVADAAPYEENPQYPLFDIAKARRVLGYEPQYSWRDFPWDLLPERSSG
jgi:nucleoside-diphosphate-sugar epimerase